jgi:hypothetical protein
MERRDFLKGTAAAIAVTLNRDNSSGAQQPPERWMLENDQIAWEFSLRDRQLSSVGFTNKLSGKRYPLRNARELRLTFSAAKGRIEIPWWHCAFGPDNDATSPEQEAGYRNGYHTPSYDDSQWDYCINPCLPEGSESGNLPHNQGRPAIVYDGYGWFRTTFQLPADAQGEEIILNLGGYDQTDWNECWVYVNGFEVGRRSSSGRWRNPAQFRIAPGSPGYASLRFGSSVSNLVALRTYAYDRHFDDLSEDVLVRYLFNVHSAPTSAFYDQFVTVGVPYLHVADFEVASVRHEQTGQGPGLVVEMRNREAAIKVLLHYELEGFLRRKWAEVSNENTQPKLLLDVGLDYFETDATSADGGYGDPVTLNEELFCAVEHPSGLNRGEGGKISLVHFPGKQLEAGERWRSYASIIGAAPPQRVREQFLSYIEAHTVRKKRFVALYDSLGITAFSQGLNWTLNEEQNIRTLELFEQWKKQGIRLDYYLAELSFDLTPSGDLKRLRLFSYPDGPAEMIARMSRMGVKYGQYFSVANGGWTTWRNPKTLNCRIANPKMPPNPLFRHGYLAGGTGAMCVASEPYFSMLKESVEYHCRENKVGLFKFDGGRYYCTSTDHDHLPGKYSTEQHFNRLIELAATARALTPDMFIVWYWGLHSPFFALHGDVMFDVRLSMEAANTCDYPALFFRDSVTQALDQGAQFAKWVPAINHDSLGVWLADIEWGNCMGTERWQEAVVMDLGRGSLLFPQLWSDIYLFEDHDVAFLARIQQLAYRNEKVFFQRRHTIGDAWKNAIYGYSYFDGERGFIFLNNVSFASRSVQIELGESLGLKAPEGRKVRLRLHFPEEAVLMRQGNPDFAVGQVAEIRLRPFEVMLIEVQPAAASDSGLAGREAIENTPVYSYPVPTRPGAYRKDLEIHFADAPDLQKRGCGKTLSVLAGQLPAYSGGRHHLAIVCTFKQGGRWWRQKSMSDFVQATGVIEGVYLEFTSTPDFRQTHNNQWNPWLVFSAPLPKASAGRQMEIGITSYLPEGVEMATDIWVVKEWWRPRSRPLPNYWI